MNKLERVLAAIEGREPDRVPTFSHIFDAKPVNDALGLPHPQVYKLMQRIQIGLGGDIGDNVPAREPSQLS